jgi:uncharacterized protein (DUF1501 family)
MAHRTPNSCDCRDEPSALSRRGFLRLGLGGGLGLALGGGVLGGLTGLRRAHADEGRALPGFGQATSVIVLWLNGGPSQIETFDPKPGVAQGGPTRAIDTSAPGIQLAHTLPRLAERMHQVALVRSMSTREGNHARARHFLHTGYVPSGTIQHPDLGSLICQQKADAEFDLPSYVAIGGATPGPGMLGVTYSPFNVGNPTQPIENLGYAQGVDAERFARRRELLAELSEEFNESRPGPETEGHTAIYAKADTMMHSPRLRAFDLEQESQALRASYGEGRFGQGCLMARRLIEEGVKVVEVQLGGWDTHQDNFNRTTELGAQLDAGFSSLLADLEEREMLSRTLVVCMGEFGRTPRINENEGRDHFARAWSMAMAGGPVRGGRVVGATSADGMEVAERPVDVPDLMASFAHASGLDREYTNYSSLGRPLTMVDSGGQVIEELFAE